MTLHSRLETAPLFMPIVGGFLKGLSVAVPLHFSEMKRGATAEQVQSVLAERYAGERFVRVMPLRDAATLADGYFDMQACNDTNRVDLFVFASDSAGAADGSARQPRQGRERRRGAVDERAPRPRRRHRPLADAAPQDTPSGGVR